MTPVSWAAHPVPRLVGTLPPDCERDLATLRSFVRSAFSDATPADAVSPADFRHVLVTGATGFMGRFLVRDLLEHDAALIVHCIVRAETAEEGLARLRANMRHAETWDDAFEARIRVHTGDMAEPRFGLSGHDFDQLCRRIDAVYHLAASLSLSASYRSLRRVNVLGVQNVLGLCLTTRLKHLFYVSTMGVFPEYIFSFAREFRDCRIGDHAQPDLARMKRAIPLGFLGYPWSKLVAEQAVLFAHSVGLPVAVFRMGQTSQASSGYTQQDNLAQRLFAAVVDVGMIPQGLTAQFADDPVDTLCRICTDISLNPNRRFTLYSCCNPSPSYRTIRFAELGLEYPEVPYLTFKRACQARRDASPVARNWAMLDHFAPYWFGEGEPVRNLPISDRAILEDSPSAVEWPGPLTRYARYSRWIRNHDDEWPHPIPRRRVSLDNLLDQARRYAYNNGVSFESTYPDWMIEGLTRFVDAVNSPESDLRRHRIAHCVFDLCRVLRNNAELASERRRLPDIGRQEIVQPVFIVGINRTGTTFLHRLLARDRQFWALRAYEYVEPVVAHGDYAAVAGTPGDPRRIKAADVFDASGIVDSFSGLHHIALDEPEEDIPILRLSLKSWVFTTRYRIPQYERWLEEAGTLEAYHLHRRTMQHYNYQRRACHPGLQGQWLFKMPTHLMELGALLEAYPDALFIQTHREPVDFMGSWCSLVERVRAKLSVPRPREEVGAEQLKAMSRMLDRAVDFRRSHPELEHRWHDVNFYDLVRDPLAVVGGIYRGFGWSIEPGSIEAMKAWFWKQEAKRRAEKRHTYDIADYGLTPAKVNTAFANYREFVANRVDPVLVPDEGT